MFFIVLAMDRPGMLASRLAHRQSHLDYWNGLPGGLRIGGAMLTDDEAGTAKGSAFILEAAGKDDAARLVAADPFSIAGIFTDDIRIEIFRPAIGDWKPG